MTVAPDAGLPGSAAPLVEVHDVLLLDLDGVVYRGSAAVPHAAEALAAARGAGVALAFVTNNALRTPEEVADRLCRFGVPAEPAEVVTSAQAAARVLATRLVPGDRVLVAGGAGLRIAVEHAGLVPVSTFEERPAAVVQGYDPQMTYARLAEAALAIQAGVLWVASNTDATVPSERGLLPGAGAFVALMETATRRQPDEVAGKPELALHRESLLRTGARQPLVVGDRLDTDIEGAVRAGVPALAVLTGVADVRDLLHAPPRMRPTHVARDLRGLLKAHPPVVFDGRSARCRGWRCGVDGGRLVWSRPGSGEGRGGDGAAGIGGGTARGSGETVGADDDGLDAVRAALVAGWRALDAGLKVDVVEPVPAACSGLL